MKVCAEIGHANMDISVSYVDKKVMEKKIVTTTELSQPEIDPPCSHLPQTGKQIINHPPQTSQQILNRKHQHQNKFQITTPIKPNILKAFLAGYDPTITNILVEGFTTGFKIPFTGKEEPTVSTNLKSAKEHIDILQTKIDREIAAGRVAGPFHTSPFANFRVSPLGLVPKRTGINDFRVIHHLSHPAGSSVNDGISDANRTVSYQSVDNAVKMILQYGRKSTLSKIDIEHAYKIVPISPSSCHLLGFRLGDKYYFDKTLPMGLSYSCNLFEKFSNAVHWIVENKLGIQGCVHVLDDFLFISPPVIDTCTCTKSTDLTRFLKFAEKLGIPIKQEKAVFPTTKLTFLGLELDSEIWRCGYHKTNWKN